MNSKVYLAGPDVFEPNHDAIFERHTAICRKLGLSALIPLDNRLTTSSEIFAFNVALLTKADAVIANITPFRGPHCDVGTAWEIAFAFAHDKPVFAFSADRKLLMERITGAALRSGRDAEGRFVEPFGLSENLMIAESIFDRTVFPKFEAAAEAAAHYFEKLNRKPRRAQSSR